MAVALVALLSVVAAACGDDDGDAAGVAAGAGSETTPADEDAGGQGAATEVEVEHAQGTTTVPFQPETVVVFDLGVLVSLDDLGVEVTGVPTVASLPESLSKYGGDGYVKVGTLFEPDYEEVNALEPDLIIVGGRSAAVYPDLAELAPTVDLTVDNADFMASFRTRAEALGEIFGLEDEVADRLDAIEADVEEVAAAGADAGSALIVLTTGGEVSAYGPGSRFGLIHDVLQVPPAVEDVEAATHGDAVSFEFILEANPEILYVVDRDAAIGEEGETAEQILDNEIVAGTTAWQEANVTYLDSFAWYIAPNGISSVETMVDDVRNSLG